MRGAPFRGTMLVMRRLACLTLLLVPVLAGPAPARASGAETVAPRRAEAPPLASTLEEEARVRRIRWPVRFVPQTPGGCDDLGPAEIEVREDGVPIRPEAVERTRLDTLHVVLIDASLSMRDRLGRAVRAAGDYVRELPAQDQVMLASFSDNLVLHAPPTRDRERLGRALERVEVRMGTAFNDALYYTVRYLQARPERKVVVVLTDGCDSTSLRLHPIRLVIELAERTENLTVYPIGVDLPASCDPLAVRVGPADGPTQMLDRLAHRSGGRLFKLRDTAGLSLVFDDIRRRMEREGFVTYRPLPFGEGPRDRADRQDERRRRVRVRSRAAGRCRVVSAGPAARIEQAAGALADAAAAAYGKPPPRDSGSRVAFRDWWAEDGAPPAAGHLELDPREIRGRATDILGERAQLYGPISYWIRGKFYAVPDGRPELGPRDFRLNVPPFEQLQRDLAVPEGVLLYLLERGLAPFRPPADASDRRSASRRELTSDWLHGQTLLELREAFGRALYGYPGYREFAGRRAGEDYRVEIERVLADSARLRELAPDEARALRAALTTQLPPVHPEHLQRYLAEWLGDVSAYDLVVGFEGWAANRLLDRRVPVEETSRMLQVVDRRWGELGEWFPPPTQVRVIAPLVPAFDADRQVVGFHRILLPQVAPLGPPEDLVPEAPLGLGLVRRLLEIAAPATFDGVRVQAIGYRHPSKRARRRIVRGAQRAGVLPTHHPWRAFPTVHLELGPADPEAPRLGCTVVHAPGPGDGPAGVPKPLCLEVAGDVAAGWIDGARGALLEIAPPCRPTETAPPAGETVSGAWQPPTPRSSRPAAGPPGPPDGRGSAGSGSCWSSRSDPRPSACRSTASSGSGS